jgi:thiamine-monophosphate kinase
MRSEFDFIQNIKNKYGLAKVGDDCAVLPKDDKTDMVVTTDMLVEDIDFRLDWTTPELLGAKTLAVSLSDIAAMGATPTWAMLSLGITKDIWNSDFVDRFYEGWFAMAEKFGVELVGGDTSKTPDKLVIDSIVSGEVGRNKVIFRSSARAGHSIFVSGTLGAAAGGLRLLEGGERLDEDVLTAKRNLILRQLNPQPKLVLANILQSRDLVSSMIDISDGFSSDLAHLCKASGVGATIENIPVDENLYAHFQNDEAMQMALHGGEDFELLFTVPHEKISDVNKLSVFCVGTTSTNIEIIEFIHAGKAEILEPKGYRHF